MYLAVLGRQSDISIAELEAQFSDVKKINDHLATFNTHTLPNINHLGGSLKLAQKLTASPLDYLINLPAGKITFGISDYSPLASIKTIKLTALKLKNILKRHGRSVRILNHNSTILSTATTLHNGLSGKNPRKIEFIKINSDWYHVIGVQNIDAYTKRDQARPARDAKVGMLPPKLAQILINLCGPLSTNARLLDPFCGTGVVLQEALLMGHRAYGTDINQRMIDYSRKNLEWLFHSNGQSPNNLFQLALGDATNFKWQPPIDAVACESYLGQPMSQIPTNIKLKTEMQTCSDIILGFFKNLANQINPHTPVVVAIPAWLREDGTYERLKILAFLEDMGYNVNNKTHEGLLYYREKQIVARDIIILRKK